MINSISTPKVNLRGAVFTVRLEGEEVASVPCEWDGSVYTASAELNAEDGYCYFVLLTSASGTESEVTINAPSAPTDETLIDLADALNTYATVTVNTSELKDGKLTITDGTAQLQLPKLTLREGNVVCQEANLILSYDGQEVAREALSGVEADETGISNVSLTGVSFTVPGEMEDDHQLSLRLEAQLSNGQSITAPGGAWYYFDGGLILSVG